MSSAYKTGLDLEYGRNFNVSIEMKEANRGNAYPIKHVFSFPSGGRYFRRKIVMKWLLRWLIHNGMLLEDDIPISIPLWRRALATTFSHRLPPYRKMKIDMSNVPNVDEEEKGKWLSALPTRGK